MRHLRYEYDLISGNVKMVRYQNGDDGMRHRYTYDADNRITEVETSADALVWHRDAEYFYYPHGPLQRVELGEHKVQGMDYAYTLQGWLKGINSDRLTPETDMGQDGLAGTANAFVGRDAFGESIGYYGDADYSAISPARWDNSSGNRPFAPVGGTGTLHGAYNPLYNGNIAHTVNSLQPFGGWVTPVQPAQVLAQVYRYDQLNRLKQAQGVAGLTGTNTWNGITDAVAERYKSQYTYDANGNIKTADGFDETGTQYDHLTYHYEKENNKLVKNRLYHLNETIDGGYGDIGVDISPFHGDHADVNELNNYQYDELGNLIHDSREEIETITWTVAGKVKHIARTPGSTKEELTFTYGADGQRLSKTVGDPLNGGYREWYLRDASGNVMAMYKYAANGTSLKLTERPIYGSSRLGSHTRQMEMVGSTPPQYYPYIQPMHAPLKRYELTDHLGNVNTVVSGRLLDGAGAGSQKQAEVLLAHGYEPFGSLLPGRNYSSDSYAHGFNGMRKDDEMHGATGTSYDFGARMYDPRVGRWLAVDPKKGKYPAWSPYHFGYCNPITTIDPNGEENVVVAGTQYDAKTANKLMFVNQALRQLKGYQSRESNETRSLVLFREGYTENQIARITKVAQERYGASVVLINSTAELTAYLTSKADCHELSDARKADPVTNLDMFAHGTPHKVRFGYSTPIDAAGTLDRSNLSGVNPGAFGLGATVSSFACRTGIGVDGENFKLFEDIKTEESLAQGLADSWGVNVKAFATKSDYSTTLGNAGQRGAYSIGLWTPLSDSMKERESVDGAIFQPDGAVNGVMGGTTPAGVDNSMRLYKPTKQ